MLYRNVHSGLRQGNEAGPIVLYCADPVPCTCPVPSPCSVNKPLELLHRTIATDQGRIHHISLFINYHNFARSWSILGLV